MSSNILLDKELNPKEIFAEVEKEEQFDVASMVLGYELSDKDRWSRSIYNKTGDRINTERIESPFAADITVIDEYIDFTTITAPANPLSGYLRVYNKSGGVDSGLFTKTSGGVEVELISTTSLNAYDLDDAYDAAPIINVDDADLDFRITDTKSFEVTNAAGSSNYFKVNSTGITAEVELKAFRDDAEINDSATSILIEQDGSGDAVQEFLLTGTRRWLVGIDNSDSDKFKISEATADGLFDSTFEIETDGTVSIGADASVGTNLNVTEDLVVGDFARLTKTQVEISGGVITAASSYVEVDTEGSGAADDLDTINGGTAGDILILKSNTTGQDPTVKDGTGNISCAGDFVMDHVDDRMMLMYDGSNWVEISRSNNA